MALVSPDFTFAHEQLTDLDLNAFSPFFDNLVVNHYLTAHYRFRRYSQFTGTLDALAILPHDSFIQSSSVNYLSGDIPREFADLEPSLTALPAFRQLLGSVNDFFGCDPEQTVLGVHQIRVICSGAKDYSPVPEGIHQDGFDLVAICCIERSNVKGAETDIFSHPDQPPVYSTTLQPGDIIYCNDRRVYHYTSPVHVRREGVRGYRDVFVITVTLNNEQWQNQALRQS